MCVAICALAYSMYNVVCRCTMMMVLYKLVSKFIQFSQIATFHKQLWNMAGHGNLGYYFTQNGIKLIYHLKKRKVENTSDHKTLLFTLRKTD